MACQYFVNGTWVSEEQFKEILNNGLLDNLIANNTVKFDKFRIDQSKVLSREEQVINRNTIPADKLADILAKEIKSRQGYPINMLSALELTPDGQNFKIPLWASPFAKKFESLLTSLITNKVIKQKFPGNSYVLGSEEGFRIKQGDEAAGELKNSGIVFSKNFDPEKGLQPLRIDKETGKILPAQIMLPFKFRDESGKILPLEEFLIKDEDGKFILDTTKFPEKLLKLFGFRIPTQERNSMAAVEIVGFLPEASGDLVLAPRDFTKQMGSDFDVDKLYTYMYNHYYQDGKLHTTFINDNKRIKKLEEIEKENLEDLKAELKITEEEDKIINRYIARENESDDNGFSAILEFLGKRSTEEVRKELQNSIIRLSVLNRSYKAARQNKILDIHLDIMTSNNPDVIASIIALDSFGEFEDLAADITQIRREQGLVEDPLTILSDTYQRTKFINATAGKNGVGAFSLDSTFNAVAQGKNLVYSNLDSDTKQKLIESAKGNPAQLAEVILENNSLVAAFGDLQSYGELSNQYTLRSQEIINKAKREKRELTDKEKQSLKFKSNIIRALQSTSVDNEKAQILDKLNINDDTFDTIRALVLLGFEEKDIVGLITQEIIWEYVDNLKEASSSLSGYTPDVEQKIFDQLVEKYDKQKRYLKLTKEQKETFASKSGEKLIENIENKKLQETENDKVITPDFNIEQLALLEKFRNLSEVGKEIKKLQSTTNAFSKGLPKSLIEVQSKLKQVSNLDNSGAVIINGENLLGTLDTFGKLTNPTTLGGFATFYGTNFAGKIYNSYFPYDTEGFTTVAQEIQLHMPQGLNMSISKQTELKQDIFDNIRSFLYANSNSNLFGDNPDLERRRLFVDSRDNMSLARILSSLSTQEWYQKNGFLNKLSFDLNKNGKISRVMFESATGENFDERDIYDGFNYLLSKNFPIGEFNNINYTSRMLAQELVAAAYLEGANQSAVQYLKYIPTAYLKSLGFGEYLSNTPFDFQSTFFGNLTTGGPVYTMPSAFTRQYFQNNPSAAKTINISDIEGTPTKLENSFKLNKNAIINNFVDIIDPATGDMTKTQTKFISIYDPKEISKYSLYEFDEVSREYKKIPVLSDKYDFVAYNSEKRFSIPVEGENIVTTTPPQMNLPGYGITNIPVEPTKEFDINVVNNTVKKDSGATLSISTDLSGTKEALDDLLNNLETAQGVSKLNGQLMVLLRNLELPTNFKVEYNKMPSEVIAGYDYINNKLVINTVGLNALSADDLATAVNHELIHALTGKAIKLYEAGKLDELNSDQIRIIEKLKSVQELYINSLIKLEGREGLNAFAKAYSEFKQTGKKGDWTTEEISKYYGALKLSEFVTMALTDARFQEELNKIQGEDSRTIWEQIKDLLANLLNSLGLDIKPGSALTVAIKDSLDLIDINQKVFKKEVAPETILEPGRYVTNNNVTYIVTKQNDNGTWQVLNPLGEGAQAKKSFAAANLKPTGFKAKLVNYKGINYLVTPRNTIISLQTNKKMNWGEENGDRRAILALANELTIIPQVIPSNKTFSENIKTFVNSIYPNWINNKENELLLTTEFKSLQLLSNGESSITDRINFGKEAEKLLKEIQKGKNPFIGVTAESQIPNLLYAAISGKLAESNISETDLFNNLFSTQAPVSSQVEKIEQKPTNTKYELFPGVYANQGQTEAIDQLTEFLNSDKQAFLLQGKGGTGKTTIIKKVLDSVREDKSVLAIAPSHKAKKVLDKSINSDKKKKNIKTITLAAALAIKLDETTGKFAPDEFARKHGKVPIKKASIIIIDESSMVSDNLLKEIKQMISPNTKIIFMGDRAQLPPVGQEKDSDVFGIKTGYELTEKMRQAATSPIINIGTKIAANVETDNRVPNPIENTDRINITDPVSGSSIKWENNENTALTEFVEDIKNSKGDVNFAKIVTFNNQNHPSPQSVKNLNEKVRLKLYGQDAVNNQFLPSEILTSYNSYSKDVGTDKELTLFNNSEDLIVEESKLFKNSRFNIRVSSQAKGTRSKEFVFDVEYLTLKNEDGDILENIPVIANSSKEAFKTAVSELFRTDPQMAYKLTAEFADLEYGYAITSHKAQGSTYTNVYVMEDNIMGLSNAGSVKAKNQSLYVAVSRPTTKLVMVSAKNASQNTDFDAEGFYIGDTKENMSLEDWENYNNIQDLFDESITESPISKDKYENYLLICGK